MLKKAMMFVLFGMLTWCSLGLPAFAADNHTWSGTVLDLRTAEPVANVLIQAGLRGRVDPFPGYGTITGSDGRFSITWPEESWRSWNAGGQNHYLRIQPQDTATTGYFNLTMIRTGPLTNLKIYLTPRTVFVKGRALSAGDEAPLRGIPVFIQRPGAVSQHAVTDNQGFFSFANPLPGFASGTTLFDVYPPALTDNQPRIPEPYLSYAVAIGDRQYEDMLPPLDAGRRFDPSLVLLSSMTDAIYTFVTLRVPQKGQPISEDGLQFTINHRPIHRILTWAEVTFPELFPLAGRIIYDLNELYFRYYPGSDLFFGGYEGNLLYYWPVLSPDVHSLGALDEWLIFAEQAGF